MSSSQQDQFYQQATQLSAEQYAAFRHAIETGKWSNGDLVNQHQRDLMLQAIIIYEHVSPAVGEPTGVLDDRCTSRSQLHVEECQQAIEPECSANTVASLGKVDAASDTLAGEIIARERNS